MACTFGVIPVHLCVTSYIISIIREQACGVSSLHGTGTISCFPMALTNTLLGLEQTYFKILDPLQ